MYPMSMVKEKQPVHNQRLIVEAFLKVRKITCRQTLVPKIIIIK
jgi:hypothetical protein